MGSWWPMPVDLLSSCSVRSHIYLLSLLYKPCRWIQDTDSPVRLVPKTARVSSVRMKMICLSRKMTSFSIIRVYDSFEIKRILLDSTGCEGERGRAATQIPGHQPQVADISVWGWHAEAPTCRWNTLESTVWVLCHLRLGNSISL